MRNADAGALLANWLGHAEKHWYALPGAPGLGCYGSGYNAWGVQTNQKYAAAAAVAAALDPAPAGLDRERARDRALAALRFSLWSHRSGPGRCTDGTAWGHTWISALGLERMGHGVAALEPHLADADRAALRRVLESEAGWLLESHERGGHRGVFGDPWDRSGRNVPESNLWNGALLWRAAALHPDHPRASDWRERAHAFLLNGVSVAADARDGRLVAGRPLRERHAGANFLPHYALDHHGYLNVGYMAICVSQAAILHFDLKAAGLERPESLDHHQADLWAVLRRMVFGDGRLARIGGDTRVRYAYCQEYLLPSLLYAADRLGDAHAPSLALRQLGLVEREAAAWGDGSFYGERLAGLADRSPYYATRLESDRACALSMYLAYAPLARPPPPPPGPFEESVAGGWSEPEHGAALHRAPRRFASFSWRAHGGPQGLCLPPGDGSLAEWEGNLTGAVAFTLDPHPLRPRALPQRRLHAGEVRAFDGGFLAWGAFAEGAELELAEGWRASDAATHRLAFAALPDGRTVVGLQRAVLGPLRARTRSVAGLNLVVPNDVGNGARRVLESARGRLVLEGPPARDGAAPLGGRWACWDGRLGAVGVYGAEELVLDRSASRRAGAYRSLHAEVLAWPLEAEPRWHDAGSTLLDAGWAVLSGADAAETRACAEDAATRRLDLAAPDLRGVSVRGADGRVYALAANFGATPAPVPFAGALDLASGATLGPGAVELAAGSALVLRLP